MKLYKVLDTKSNREFKPNLIGYAFEGLQSGEYTILNINATETVTILSEGIEIIEGEKLMTKSKLHTDLKYSIITESKRGYRVIIGTNRKGLTYDAIIYNYDTKEIIYRCNANLDEQTILECINELAYIIDKHIDNKHNLKSAFDDILLKCNRYRLKVIQKEMINNYIEEQKEIRHEQLKKENKELEQQLNKLIKERNLYLLNDTIMAVIDFKDKRCNKFDNKYVYNLLTKEENKETLQKYINNGEIYLYFIYENNANLQGHNDNLRDAISYVENNIIIKDNKTDKLIIDKIKPRVIQYFVKELNIYDENIIDNEINNIINISKDIRNKLNYKGGIYYSVNELFKDVKLDNEYYKYFIMDALKMQDIEFYNNEEYRVCS
ncbi:hypothetical protein [Clostridium sp. M14]|uniref:hypothetical protein n=1 Tax=Clostridium sp. M14 TaxID=2716311 RepID=UPI0013EEBD5E|nr:hypothetical protein [Clostridium sp. M14]MBZ9693386.1 hypothetical protein [Clostridium sp. M14]